MRQGILKVVVKDVVQCNDRVGPCDSRRGKGCSGSCRSKSAYYIEGASKVGKERRRTLSVINRSSSPQTRTKPITNFKPSRIPILMFLKATLYITQGNASDQQAICRVIEAQKKSNAS